MTSPRRRRALASLVSTAALLAGALGAASAEAQTKTPGMDLERYQPSAAGDAFFGVDSPAIGGHLSPRGFVTFDYASRPLRIDTSTKSSVELVDSQAFLHVGLSLPLWDRVLVAVELPVAVLQSSTDPKIAGLDYHLPSSAAVGDFRFGLRGRFFGGWRDPFQLGLGGWLTLPTGSKDNYTGQGAARGELDVLLGGRAGSGGVGFVWNAEAGGVVQGALVSPLLRYGVGAAVVLVDERLQIGPEMYGTTQLGSTTNWTLGTGVPAGSKSEIEVLGGAKFRIVGGLYIGAAGGAGVLSAVGSPGVRVIGSLGWAQPPGMTAGGYSDRDGDGIADDVDACPDVPGVLQSDPKRDGCPIADRDGDGVPDADDACPDEAGDRNIDPTKNGCPVDTDEDGVPDRVDACPKIKGVKSADPKLNGCPVDRDHDGVPDDVDACPDVPGVASSFPRFNGCPEDMDGDGVKNEADACPYERGLPDPDPKVNGCPKYVRVEEGEIKILAQVQFKSNGRRKSETVSPLSEELMKEIRDVIVQHPEILRIEVQGHTDDEGTAAYNLQLSQERAEAVRQWLIDSGIPKDKLVAKGYGWEQSIGDNRNRSGREKNRRVQFVILERGKK